ncbi:MAG: hypothetical protein BRD34_01200 [Bacteroidetes bacterium QH_6_64_77]|nr:MAG: hypothetical protein BRD34_01200 [Bacteroidetes bacterium QH_6_64_77]
MPAVQTDAIESRLARRLDPHGSEGVRAALSGVVDLESLEKRQYEDFGLLVGFWLVNGSTWGTIALWGIPVLLVTAYGLYSTHQTVRQIRHLSEARALLRLLMDGTPSPEDPDGA